ncbi:hypothetical protein EDC01DRAFT_627132 [Geopyxis carbonaria]|nr:hypothetical protein EDC01DRAFT_627132 [Geopyxis carbonaria]
MQLQLRAPADVSVEMRFRDGTRTAYFSWAYRHETQLDFQLAGRIDRDLGHQWEGPELFTPAGSPIGLVVGGQLYVDDRVFWLGLLKEGETYRVAYNSKIPRPYGLYTKMHDYFYSTPLYDACDIPQPDYRYCSSRMRARLVEHGMLKPESFQLRGFKIGNYEWRGRGYDRRWPRVAASTIKELNEARQFEG